MDWMYCQIGDELDSYEHWSLHQQIQLVDVTKVELLLERVSVSQEL